MKNNSISPHKHWQNVSLLILLFLSSSVFAEKHEILSKEIIEKNFIIFLPDSLFDDTSEITEEYAIGDTVETYSDGMDSIYILFDDTIASDSTIDEKLFTFPTPHMLIEIGDKHLPIQPDLFGVNVTDMFEPNKATEANNAMYTVTSDPWELLAALKPKVLRFPTGSGSKYMHLLGSDNADGTRNSGYGFKIEEIIPYYDKTDNEIDIFDIPFELTILADDFAGGPGDPPGDCDDCESWMESGDVKTFEDYYNKWDSQTPFTPTGDLETQNLAINEFIKCVKAIESANPGHVVDVVVCLNILSETADGCKNIIEYLTTNDIYHVRVVGIEMGNECYFPYFDRTIGISNFEHYWDYVNGGNYESFGGTDHDDLFDALPPSMEVTGAHDFITTLKGAFPEIRIGIPVANLPNCFDAPFFADGEDQGGGGIGLGGDPCDPPIWNQTIVNYYDVMAYGSIHAFDAVILHPYYTPKNNPSDLFNENWFMRPLCLDGNEATPVVIDGDVGTPSGIDKYTGNVPWDYASYDARLDCAFDGMIGLGDLDGNIRTLITGRYKEAFDLTADHLNLQDVNDGPDNKELWTTEWNILDKDDSPSAFETGVLARLGAYSNTLIHAELIQEWFLKNIKMNFDHDYLQNFYTIATIQSFIGGNAIDLTSFADYQDEMELGIMTTCPTVGDPDGDFVPNYFVARSLYQSMKLLSAISANSLHYLQTETSMYISNINLAPTVFIDPSYDNLYVYYTNVKNTTQLYAIDPADLEVITGYPVELQEPVTIYHVNPSQLYSNSGKSMLWTINDAYDATCEAAGTHTNRFEIRQTTSTTDPVGGCPGMFTSGICVTVPASSVGYFVIPINPLRLGLSDNDIFSIYPNPSSTYFTVAKKSGLDNTEILQIEIYEATGKLIQKTESSSGQVIDISQLPVGVYTVLIKMEGLNTESETLVKMK